MINNLCIFIGRVTRDTIEIPTSNQEKRMFKNGLAIAESKDKATFIELKLWGVTGERFQALAVKGSKVAVQCRITSRKADDGKIYTDFVVDSFELMTQKEKPQETKQDEVEELPFDF